MARVDAMIEARGLRKTFGEGASAFEAVKGIDVEVRRGEAFGFLGPNGAGKSSTMRMVAAVSPVSGGELRILGRDPATDGPAIRARIGVCPQEDTLDAELNVFENLFIYGRYFGLPKAVVRQARARLAELEAQGRDAPSAPMTAQNLDSPQQFGLFAPSSAALEALAGIEPDELTPKQALEALYRLKALQ